MNEMFVSFCQKDKNLVEEFLDFLQLGMGITKEQIFCTLCEDSLIVGKNYIDKIRKEIKEARIVVAIITEDYLKSKSCMMELGAAWVLEDEKIFFPIVVSPVTFEKVENSLLKGYQLSALNKAGLLRLYDLCVENGIVRHMNTDGLSKKAEEFLKKETGIQKGTNLILKPDDAGYFETEIMQRRPTPEIYRCYLIKGKIDQTEAYKPDESHWLFFRTGMFPDLKNGDRIRFKVGKTELKSFKDLENARNLYPVEVERIE